MVVRYILFFMLYFGIVAQACADGIRDLQSKSVVTRQPVACALGRG